MLRSICKIFPFCELKLVLLLQRYAQKSFTDLQKYHYFVFQCYKCFVKLKNLVLGMLLKMSKKKSTDLFGQQNQSQLKRFNVFCWSDANIQEFQWKQNSPCQVSDLICPIYVEIYVQKRKPNVYIFLAKTLADNLTESKCVNEILVFFFLGMYFYWELFHSKTWAIPLSYEFVEFNEV